MGLTSKLLLFLLTFVLPLHAQTSLDPSEVLDNARERIVTAMRSLPKYACLETDNRTYYTLPVPYFAKVTCDQLAADRAKGRKAPRIDSTDRLRLEVAYGADGEMHSFPHASRFDLVEIDQIVDRGPFATGPFGGYLGDIFDNDGTQYDYRGTQFRAGHQVFVYGYVVAESVSHYEVRAGDSWIISGYSGTFDVNPRTFEIGRLTIDTSELPAETNLCEARATLDYQRTKIGDGEFLLPQQSQLRMIQPNGQETNSTVVFSECREFRGQSAVYFDSPENRITGKLETPRVHDGPRPSLPPNLAVDLRLDTAIDSDTSAAGDVLTATVVKDVHQGFDTLIPAGAVVHGRISRMEHHYTPIEYLVIGFAFESVEFGGETSPFMVRTELPAHYTGTVPIDSIRKLFARLPEPPPDSLVFPREKQHLIPAGTVTHWITWTK